MAGSYKHVTNDYGQLYDGAGINSMLECMSGDVVEAVTEMYGMIWWLADGDPRAVEAARILYREGIQLSPGIDAPLPVEE